MESSTVGEQLRRQRLLLGLSLEEIAGETHIQKSFLEALEVDNFDRIPGKIYVKGFLRQYAEMVRLRPDDILNTYQSQIAPVRSEDAPEAGTEKTGSLPVNRGKLLLCAVLSLPVLILVYYLSTSPDTAHHTSAETQSDASPPQIAEPAGDPALSPAPTATDAPSEELAVSVPPSAEEPLIAQPDWPHLPKRASVRVRATGDLELKVKVDDLPESTYRLIEGSILSWLPRQKIVLSSSLTEASQVSLNGTELPFDRDGSIVLVAD